MAKIRETEVERDGDGRVVNTTEHVIERPKKRGGGFGWGLLLGVIVVAGAILAFAYHQGSFQSAGARADHATAQVEQQIDQRAAPQEQAAIPNNDTVSN